MIREIPMRVLIEKYLSDYGYDGLCSENCGCFSGDLAPCEHLNLDRCFPGVACMDSEGARIIRRKDFREINSNMLN